MKKVKFLVEADELVVELPDSYTEEDIGKTFQAWLDSMVNLGWDFIENQTEEKD